ncbi:hypothetical protein [Candidatus Protochlamydia amoebophila]|uniref:Uncharacterized protein n=1 Tax=Candidatus Protochlamydia amoebophila TaxID=362787 RepID=A0A0C1JJB2_9BACT|nr:hypothetical protein [Candidatus Protochlamydia amoebophila]KIC71450.1 hypothetical protein DB44_DP00090 [Candidatus Protochlamydia amoebophila]
MNSHTTLESCLNSCLRQVNQVIIKQKNLAVSDVRNEKTYLVLQGSLPVRLMLENAKIAFNDVTSVDQLSAENQQIIEKIQRLADQLNPVQQLPLLQEQECYTLINHLPFKIDYPSLRSIFPMLVLRSNVKEQDRLIQLKFSGHFKGIQQPIIKFNDQTHQVKIVSDHQLSLDLKPSDIFGASRLTAKTLTFCEGELQVPWKGKNQEKFRASFKVLLGILPPIVGTLTLSYTTKKIVTQSIRRDHPHAICSRSCCGNNDQLEGGHFKTLTTQGDAGWWVDPGTIQVHVTAADGERHGPRNTSLAIDRRTISWEARTIKKTWGTSGWFDFAVTFNQSKEDRTSITHFFNLNWNAKDRYPVTEELVNWEATFQTFNGKTYCYPKEKSPYLSIEWVGQKFVVTTTSPKELKDF